MEEQHDSRFDGVTVNASDTHFFKCIFVNCAFASMTHSLFTECSFIDCDFGQVRSTTFVFCDIITTRIASLDMESYFDLCNLRNVSGVRYAQYGNMLAVYHTDLEHGDSLLFHRYDEECGDINDWQERLTAFIDVPSEGAPGGSVRWWLVSTEAEILEISETREMLWKVSELL